MSIDAVYSQKLADHQHQLDDGEAYDTAVYYRVEELLKTPEFDPTDSDNIYAAVLDFTKEQIAELQSLKDHDLHRQTANRFVHDHYAVLAQKHAEHEMEQSCHYCKGRGCRYCDDTDCD